MKETSRSTQSRSSAIAECGRAGWVLLRFGRRKCVSSRCSARAVGEPDVIELDAAWTFRSLGDSGSDYIDGRIQ